MPLFDGSVVLRADRVGRALDVVNPVSQRPEVKEVHLGENKWRMGKRKRRENEVIRTHSAQRWVREEFGGGDRLRKTISTLTRVK